MASRKSGVIRSHSGHDLLPEYVTRQRLVLTMILNGYFSYSGIASRTGLTKRKVELCVKDLVRNNLIHDKTPNVNKHKVYSVTQNGKSFLGGVRTREELNKRIVSENVRAKCQVLKLDQIQNVLNHPDYSFKRNELWRNSMQYHGHVNNHRVQVDVGKTVASLQLTAPPYSETSGALVGYLALSGIIETCYILNSKWDLGLTSPQLTSGEYVIHTPIAEAMMRKTHGKQVKGKIAWVNQSRPFFLSQFESHDPLDPDAILAIPKTVTDIQNKIVDINLSMMRIDGNAAENSFRSDQLQGLVAGLAQSVEKIAGVVKEQNSQVMNIQSSMSTIAQKLTELLGSINPQNQVTSGHALTEDHSRMFQ